MGCTYYRNKGRACFRVKDVDFRPFGDAQGRFCGNDSWGLGNCGLAVLERIITQRHGERGDFWEWRWKLKQGWGKDFWIPAFAGMTVGVPE